MGGVAIAPEERGGVIERVAELLEVTYRSADLGNVADPLAETIYILLARQTQEEVYQRQYAELRAKWPRWIDALAAPRAELADLLRGSGLQQQRAEQIQQPCGLSARTTNGTGADPMRQCPALISV